VGLSSSSKTSTTNTNSTSTSAPYAAAQPYVDSGITDLNNIYTGNQDYSNQLASSLLSAYNDTLNGAYSASNYAQNAQNAASNIANGNYLGTNPGSSTYASLMAGGSNPATNALTTLASGTSPNPASTSLASIASGNSTNPAAAALAQLTGGSTVLSDLAANGTTSPSAQFYSDVLSGKYLNGNPYLDSIVQQGTDAATKAANQRFGAAGLGANLSTPYTDVLAKDVTNASNSLRYTDYQNQLNLMQSIGSQADAQANASNTLKFNAANANAQNELGAATALGSQYLTGQQNQTQAANDLGNQFLTGQQNQTTAANALGSQNLAAASAADTNYNAQIQQILSALGLTGTLTSAQFAGVDPTLSVAGAASSAPYSNINDYINALNALAGKYGTVNSTGTGTNTSTSDPSLLDDLGSLVNIGKTGVSAYKSL
jgi:hypothetical protein